MQQFTFSSTSTMRQSPTNFCMPTFTVPTLCLLHKRSVADPGRGQEVFALGIALGRLQ